MNESINQSINEFQTETVWEWGNHGIKILGIKIRTKEKIKNIVNSK